MAPRRFDNLIVLLFLTSLSFGSACLGQLPTPNQWDSLIQGSADQATLTTTPSDFVRHQIGLASYEEPVDTIKHNQPTPDATSIDRRSDFQSLLAPEQLTSRDGLGSTLQTVLLIAVLSLAPAIALMTTCYIRVIVVLTLLKQAFGAQQLPPNQVLTALSLFITLLVMSPVWNQVKTEAIDPYTRSENGITWEEAWQRGVEPVKSFMANQILSANNEESVALFYRYLPNQPPENLSFASTSPTSAENRLPIDSKTGKVDIRVAPLSVLLPAFVISELKVAFLLGFQIYLPFLVLDLVVSSVTVSSGMLMLPPTMVSFPLKLIMFVLVDGWNLVVGMLLQSFYTFP